MAEVSLKLRMSAHEIEVFRQYLPKFDSLLEFGCGGSTLYALRNGCPRVFSVDSDVLWIGKVEEASADNRDRLITWFADIGEVRKWGHPVIPATAERAARYHSDVWNVIDLHRPALCLIDGRFRMACLVQAFRRMANGSVILFHDFVGRAHFESRSSQLPTARYAGSFAIFEKSGAEDEAALNSVFESVRTASA